MILFHITEDWGKAFVSVSSIITAVIWCTSSQQTCFLTYVPM